MAILARFLPEVWINDEAVAIDQPTELVNVTERINAERASSEYINGLLIELARTGEVTDRADWFVDAFGERVQAHAGIHPFTITLTDDRF